MTVRTGGTCANWGLVEDPETCLMNRNKRLKLMVPAVSSVTGRRTRPLRDEAMIRKEKGGARLAAKVDYRSPAMANLAIERPFGVCWARKP